MGYFVKKDKHGNEGLILPTGPTSDRPATPIKAAMRFNTDTQSIEYFNGTVFVDVAKAGVADTSFQKFTADGSTATFTMNTQYTDAERILVFIDGVLQLPTANYDVSGFDLILTSAPPDNLKILVVHGIGNTYVTDGDVFDVPNL